ncbi:MAG: hypothetical protein ACP5ID_03650 [Conexivisphaera sp.]
MLALLPLMAAGTALTATVNSPWAAILRVSYGGTRTIHAAPVRDTHGGEVAGGIVGAWVIMEAWGSSCPPP